MNQAKFNKQLEITVNLGDFQNIKLQSGTDRELHFENDEDRVSQEASLWHELCEDINAALRNCLEDLGKQTDAPAVFAKQCRNKLEGKG